MSRAVACMSLVLFLSVMIFGQSAEKSPAFDVADVHTSVPTLLPGMIGGVLRGGRYEIRSATMVDLINTAYGIEDDKVLGGPSWLESDRFDVIAKAPKAHGLCHGYRPPGGKAEGLGSVSGEV